MTFVQILSIIIVIMGATFGYIIEKSFRPFKLGTVVQKFTKENVVSGASYFLIVIAEYKSKTIEVNHAVYQHYNENDKIVVQI